MTENKPFYVSEDYNLIEQEQEDLQAMENYSDLDNLTVYYDTLHEVYYNE